MPLLEPKSWLASKTLWINGLTLAVTVLTALTSSSILTPGLAPYLLGALAVVNLALRFLTDQPLKSIEG